MSNKAKLIIAVVCLWYFSIFTDIRPDYSKTQVIQAEVVQLYSGTSTGKYSHLEFIAVYEDNQGRRFDQNVSAAFYSSAKVGQIYNIETRPELIYDEYRSGWPLALGFGSAFLYVITYGFAILFSMILLILLLPKSIIEWE